MLFRTIAQFEKVSYEQFFNDFVKTFNLQTTRKLEDGTIEMQGSPDYLRKTNERYQKLKAIDEAKVTRRSR